MVNHTCNRCGYTTNRKQNLKTHLLKKNTCKQIIEMISIYDVLKSNGFDEEAIKYKNIHNVNSTVNSTVNSKSNNHICKHCKKTFTTRQGKSIHIKKYCSVVKSNDELSINKNIMEQNKILKENNDKLTLQVEQLINKMALLKTKNISKISNKTNNINKGIVNNIVINNYGSENIDYITFNKFVKLLETPLSAISKLIELKHFNEKHPENHNIKITNIHDKFAKIYKDKKWLVSNKKDIIQDLVENGYADFEEFKDLNEEELTNKIKERYGKMEKYYTENAGELYKQSEMSIINGTNKLE
jgi:ribosomal protein L37AE/L43A